MSGAARPPVDHPSIFLRFFKVGDITEVPNPYLGLAVAIPVALLSPQSGMDLWLTGLPVPDGCRDLVSVLLQFNDCKPSLCLQNLLDAKPAARPAMSASAISDSARRWLEDSERAWGGFSGCGRIVWKRLAAPPAGPLHTMMRLVAENKRNELATVRQLARRWADHSYCDGQIQKIYREEVFGSGEIDGRFRKRLLQKCKETVRLASSWCDSPDVDSTDAFPNAPDPSELVSRCRDGVRQALVSLKRVRVPEYPLEIACSAHCLERSLIRVAQILGEDLDSPPFDSSADEAMRWPHPSSDDIVTLLSRRLWWLPEVSCDSSGLPDRLLIASLPSALRQSAEEGRSLQGTLDRWLEERNFQIAANVLATVQADPRFPDMRDRYEDHLQHARRRLGDFVSDTTTLVERGMLDGVVRDQRSELLSVIEAIDLGTVLRFKPVFAKLEERVRRPLEVLRRERLDDCRRRWVALKSLLPRAGATQADVESISQQIEAEFKAMDTRVLDERLSALSDALDADSDLPMLSRLGWTSAEPTTSDLERFQSANRVLEPVLGGDPDWAARAIASAESGSDPLVQFQLSLPPAIERKEEVLAALRSWRALGSGRENPQIYREVGPIMSFLGFRTPTGPSSLKPVQLSGEWMLMRGAFSGAPNSVRPLSQLGSRSQDIQHVLLVWRRPGPARLAEILAGVQKQLQRSTDRTLIVFYLGSRTEAERHTLATLNWERHLEPLVLDDNLLLFLAAEGDVRLPAFINTTAPFTACIPYTPDDRGQVAAEMFVGREAFVDAVWNAAGPSLIFGGRQLGKTTLQNRVREIHHAPQRQHFVWCETLSYIYDPEADKGADHLWLRLAERMKETGCKIQASRPDHIAREIAEFIQDEPNSRILFLLDESDRFLDDDAMNGFREVKRLRELMQQTTKRFKVVFAGNRVVERFDSIPDQPLAQFGRALLIGPLEPPAASELVERPMRALGYQFDSDSTLLRILSCTNYHAVCIHAFCDALLRRLRERRPARLPQAITRAEVEAVYQDRKVREMIQSIFRMTLALEDDYVVMTLAMIADQLESDGSFERGYAAREVFALARDVWPLGFQDTPTDFEAFQLRLEKMCGLGVLVRSGAGQYRLRSPNLVRLLGSDSDVQTELLRFREKPRAAKTDLEGEHVSLDTAAGHYSPLTYAQSRLLNQAGSGVTILYSSPALGGKDLPAVVRRLIPSQMSQGVKADFSIVAPPPEAPEDLRQWLQEYVADHDRHDRLAVYCSLPPSHRDIGAWIEEVLPFCRRRISWLRVHLALDHESLWHWLRVSNAERSKYRVDTFIVPKKWSARGLQRRLEQQNLPATDDQRRAILDATRGWPILLDRVLRSNGSTRRAPIDLAQFDREFDAHGSAMRAEFETAVGFNVVPEVRTVLSFIQRNEGITRDYVSPVLIEGPGITEEVCDAALQYLQIAGAVDVEGETLRVDRLVKRCLLATEAV